MSFRDDLLSLIKNDALGILDITPKKSNLVTADQRLVDSFQEINEFYITNGREPMQSNDIDERKLYARLKGLREQPDKAKTLTDFDIHGLLAEVKDKIESLSSANDVIKDDPLGLLEDETENIYDLKHVPSAKQKEPDYIGKRTKIDNFDSYDKIFKVVQSDLKSKRRLTVPFKGEKQIETGEFFVLQGQLVYVESIGTSEQGAERFDARTRCIFENGTASDILYRSLGKALWRSDNSRHVVAADQLELGQEYTSVSADSKLAGYIYVLESKSESEEIKKIRDLYKIGFSKRPTRERISNAKNDTTYLLADVYIKAEYECYDLRPQKLEYFMHKFLDEVKLDIELLDSSGDLYKPKEWFVVPFEIIDQAIKYLITGEIVDYRYDPVKKEIINRT